MAVQIEQLKKVLSQFEVKTQEVAQRLDRREDRLVAILEGVGWADRRGDLTQASKEFEAARHRVRLAMCVIAVDQQNSMADLARALGVSRQLTHRLCREATGVPFEAR